MWSTLDLCSQPSIFLVSNFAAYSLFATLKVQKWRFLSYHTFCRSIISPHSCRVQIELFIWCRYFDSDGLHRFIISDCCWHCNETRIRSSLKPIILLKYILVSDTWVSRVSTIHERIKIYHQIIKEKYEDTLLADFGTLLHYADT